MYQRPAAVADSNTGFTAVINRLDRIESKVEELSKPSGPHLHTLPSPRQSAPDTAVPVSPQAAPLTPAYKMPNLQNFRRWDAEEHFADYDLTGTLYRDQANTVTEFKRALRTPLPDIDLTRPRLWGLERSFSENALKLLGLLHPRAVTKYLHEAESTGYAEHSLSSCLALLIFAVGAAAMDSAVYVESSRQLPGFVYYSRGISIRDTLSNSESSLEGLQARVLSGSVLHAASFANPALLTIAEHISFIRYGRCWHGRNCPKRPRNV